MKRSTPNGVLLVLAVLVVAAIGLESPRTVLGEEPPAPAAVSFEVDRAMTLPEFLREVEKRVPGLFTFRAQDKHIAQATVPLGTYSLNRAKLVRHLRALLFSREIVLLPSGVPPQETYAVTDMRASVKPGDPVLEPIQVDIDSRPGLMHEYGLYVTGRIPVTGLSHLDAVKRVLGVVLTRENVGRIKLLPGGSAFEVTDFAPRVDLVRRLAKELAALQALNK